MNCGHRVLTAFIMVTLPFCLVGFGFAAEMTESIGNKDLNEANYTDWPGIMELVNRESRVYQFDVNGHEQLFYEGDVDELNSALQDFSKLDFERHQVVLLPGSGLMKTPIEKVEIGFNWKMQIVGGIINAATFRHENADLVWPKEPAIYVYVDDKKIKLNEIRVPPGIEVQSIDDLIKNHKKAIEVAHDQIRGNAIHNLGDLVAFDKRAMAIVLEQLKSESDWTVINAAVAIRQFGNMAAAHVPELNEISESHSSQRVKKALVKSIDTIESAKPVDPKVAKSHAELVRKLNAFAEMPQYIDD